jgi:hypothetical protein
MQKTPEAARTLAKAIGVTCADQFERKRPNVSGFVVQRSDVGDAPVGYWYGVPGPQWMKEDLRQCRTTSFRRHYWTPKRKYPQASDFA